MVDHIRTDRERGPPSPVMGHLAINSIPLRSAVLNDSGDDVADFSSVDVRYYGADFSLTIDATPYTDCDEFPAITPYHIITVLGGGETHLYAVGCPLSILGESVVFQIFARRDGQFVVPGILRAPLCNTYLPAAYPPLPTPSSRLIDAFDPTWNLIVPARRLHGWIQFTESPVGNQCGVETHSFMPFFDDELIREWFNNVGGVSDAHGGVSVLSRQG